MTDELSIDEVLTKMQEIICKRQSDLNFRIQLLKTLPQVCKGNSEKAKLFGDEIFDKMKDYDQEDFQTAMGKSLSSLWTESGQLSEKFEMLMESVKQSYQAELQTKRNCLMILYEIVCGQGKTNDIIQGKLIQIQQIFLKYLFDTRSSIQDLSSQALSTIYNIGDGDIKKKLVESLSNAFTGEGDMAENENMEENKELPKQDLML